MTDLDRADVCRRTNVERASHAGIRVASTTIALTPAWRRTAQTEGHTLSSRSGPPDMTRLITLTAKYQINILGRCRKLARPA